MTGAAETSPGSNRSNPHQHPHNGPPNEITDLPTGEVVYFIRRGTSGLIKIGCTKRLALRRRELQSASRTRLVVIGWLSGGYDEEHRLHRRFAASRVRGEWFRPTADLLSLIVEIADPAKRAEVSKELRPRTHFLTREEVIRLVREAVAESLSVPSPTEAR